VDACHESSRNVTFPSAKAEYRARISRSAVGANVTPSWIGPQHSA
jgi:hypothetical protein